MAKASSSKKITFVIPKSLTGIRGLDDITNGGLPKNRPTLLIGGTGCGKTIIAIEFLINGIELYNEPAVFVGFEENTTELIVNVKSFGFNLEKHVSENNLFLDHLNLDRDKIVATGNYDLEGLFVRLGQAIDKVKAKRIVLDSLDALFYGLDVKIIRHEFKRLITWLKQKKVTAIITAEMDNYLLNGNRLEEYVADCVIILNNRVTDQITTRRLRIIKYRGSSHGNNEYPFEIDEKGVTVFPLISEAILQKSGITRISSGVKDLDFMLDEKGFYAGSSILISGTAGTGKTSIATSFAISVCKNEEECLFCAFEESPNQIIRNMNSIGLKLKPYVKSGLLNFYYARPTLQNLELHFFAIKKLIKEKRPAVVILDPITNLMTEGPNSDIRSMLTRFVDFLKTQHITVMFTAAITAGSIERNPSDEGISSMVDTWMMVQEIEFKAERTRSLCIMKARGMPHSVEVKNFHISSKGITLSKFEDTKNFLNNADKSAKEHENLSTSKGSIDPKDSARSPIKNL